MSENTIGKTPRIITPRQKNYDAWRALPESSGDPHDIVSAAILAPNTHNSQPWEFRVSERTITSRVNPDLVLPASDKTGRQSMLSLGAAIANMEIVAQYYGYNTTESLDYSGDSLLINTSLYSNHVRTARDEALFRAIHNRVNYDGDHTRRRLTDRVERIMQSIFEAQEGVSFHLIIDQPTKDKVAELIESGDRIIFTDEDFTSELGQFVVDAATSQYEGIPTPALGVPKTMRRDVKKLLLSNDDEAIDLLAKSDKAKIKKSTAIGFISAKDTDEMWVKVGKLYQRLSLVAASEGVYLGAKGVLIETPIRSQLGDLIDLPDGARPLMMFRVGYPAQDTLYHSPRYPAKYKTVFNIEGVNRKLEQSKPTIFSVKTEEELEEWVRTFGVSEVNELAYTEHFIPDLFRIRNPHLDVQSEPYQEELRNFLGERDIVSSGVWVYRDGTLVHYPTEDEFYEIITASNRGKISDEAQQNLRRMKVGIMGQSGSGKEAARAAIMLGVKHLWLADPDYLSAQNTNRVAGIVGENKAYQAAQEWYRHNPFLDIEVHQEGVTSSNVSKLAANTDIAAEQSDGLSKWDFRQAAEVAGCSIVMVTDAEVPVVLVERPEEYSFIKKAEEKGITRDKMKRIRSTAQATGYVAAIIGDRTPSGEYEMFNNILSGDQDWFSQLFPDVQVGGGVFGKLLIAYAEGKIRSIPPEFTVDVLPVSNSEEGKGSSKTIFEEKYKKQYGEIF